MTDSGKLPVGSKFTRVRYNDELARVGWQEFERMMARWYADEGWKVTHRGTGKTGRLDATDGGIDLVLERDTEKVIVQCKHHKVLQVPYKPVVELRGLMHVEKADRAILITTGEFTHAALRKARQAGQITMIDGVALRKMLGPNISTLRDAWHVPSDLLGPAPVIVAMPPPTPAPTSVISPVASGRPTTDLVRTLGQAPVPHRQVPPLPRRQTPRMPRLVALSCVVIAVAATGVVGTRLRDLDTSSTPSPPTIAVADTRATLPPAPVKSQKATARNMADRRAAKREPASSAVLPRTTTATTAPIPESVIYKSSNMSDEEFAAWKRRKALREREEVQEIPASRAEERPAVRASADSSVSTETMRTILKTNRR